MSFFYKKMIVIMCLYYIDFQFNFKNENRDQNVGHLA